jgi:hypothetical protein
MDAAYNLNCNGVDIAPGVLLRLPCHLSRHLYFFFLCRSLELFESIRRYTLIATFLLNEVRYENPPVVSTNIDVTDAEAPAVSPRGHVHLYSAAAKAAARPHLNAVPRSAYPPTTQAAGDRAGRRTDSQPSSRDLVTPTARCDAPLRGAGPPRKLGCDRPPAEGGARFGVCQ